MEREIYLKLGKTIFHIGNIGNTNDIYLYNNVEEDELKKFFLYKIMDNTNNPRILLLGLMYQIIDLDLYDDYIVYEEQNNLINIFLNINDKKILLASTKTTQIEKIREQIKKNIYKNINEALLKNIMGLYNIENNSNNEVCLNIFLQIISYNSDKIIENDKKLLNNMTKLFIKNTVLR